MGIALRDRLRRRHVKLPVQLAAFSPKDVL